MPPEARSTARPSPLRLWGFLVTAAGALVVGIGALLNWAVLGFPNDPSGSLDVPVKGVDVWEGKVVLAAALLSLLGTLALRFPHARDSRRALALGVVTLGALAMALALSVAMRPQARFVGDEGLDQVVAALSPRLDLPPDVIRAQLEEELARNLKVELGPGVWLTVAGGLLVVVGGSLSLAWAGGTGSGSEASGASRRSEAPPAGPAGPGDPTAS